MPRLFTARQISDTEHASVSVIKKRARAYQVAAENPHLSIKLLVLLAKTKVINTPPGAIHFVLKFNRALCFTRITSSLSSVISMRSDFTLDRTFLMKRFLSSLAENVALSSVLT